MKSKTKLIIRCNSLLNKKFGVPKRQKPFPNPLDLLIATILSQNTNDNNSFKAYQNLKKRFSNWTELLNVKRIKIEQLIRAAGLAEQKSKSIKNLIVELDGRKDFSLSFLDKLDNSMALKELTYMNGIGVKTASCVLLFALDRNVCPVDTHVHRTVNRIGIVSEKTADKTFYSLNENFPDAIAHSFHTNLIRLGREICKPQNPRCYKCPVEKICRFENKNFEKSKTSVSSDFMLLDNV
jgi:endonuclease-3